jgi:polyisoprenoid-binding protein YceI
LKIVRWSCWQVLALLLAAMAVAVPVHAQQLVFDFDPGQTQIEFSLGATFHTVHGSFSLKTGTLTLDPATGKAGGQIIVDATSGASGNQGRDKRMHKEILETQKFTEIVFLPDRVVGQIPPQGDFHITVHGTFRLHGADHETTLEVQAQRNPDGIAATAQFAIPYVKWGIKNPSTFLLHVSDQVQIHIHTFARPVPSPATQLR